jgi:hypothetical protein
LVSAEAVAVTGIAVAVARIAITVTVTWVAVAVAGLGPVGRREGRLFGGSVVARTAGERQQERE